MIPVDHHTYAKTHKPRYKLILNASASCFTLGCQVHEIMVPLAHATSEVSDKPAHPHSLARGITAHIHIEGTCLKLGL